MSMNNSYTNPETVTGISHEYCTGCVVSNVLKSRAYHVTCKAPADFDFSWRRESFHNLDGHQPLGKICHG